VLPFVLLHWLRLDAAYHPEHHALQLPPRLGAVELIDRRLVERAHAHNAQVHAWTINDAGEMQQLIDLGIDGIITDYPNRLLKILQRQPLEERR
jgi:glycerophosphoryl diester phosphodiesterase